MAVCVGARVKDGLSHLTIRSSIATLRLLDSHLSLFDPLLDNLAVDVGKDNTKLLDSIRQLSLLILLVVLDRLLHLPIALLEANLHDVDDLIVAEGCRVLDELLSLELSWLNASNLGEREDMRRLRRHVPVACLVLVHEES